MAANECEEGLSEGVRVRALANVVNSTWMAEGAQEVKKINKREPKKQPKSDPPDKFYILHTPTIYFRIYACPLLSNSVFWMQFHLGLISEEQTINPIMFYTIYSKFAAYTQ